MPHVRRRRAVSSPEVRRRRRARRRTAPSRLGPARAVRGTAPTLDTGARLPLYRVYLALVMRVDSVPRAYGGDVAVWLDTWSADRVRVQLAVPDAWET
ncbi:hypothetical protein ACIP8Z_05935 [Streptomyces sp. NPDC088553]|uniref:hypothetical protein n=1 Tax=Streptomyces sp. NPDC088553 TaxID=3365864 RepID=UPI00380E2263